MTNKISTKKTYDTKEIGEISVFPKLPLPEGFVECNGQSLNRESYPDLFAYLGVDYGAEDTVTFKVPDYRGVFLRGYDPSAVSDPDGVSRAIGSYQADELKSHTHTISEGSSVPVNGGTLTSGDDYTTITAKIQTSSGAGGAETRPKNKSVVYGIKAIKIAI